MNTEYIKDYFKFEHNAKANEEAFIQGKTYRITVLTSRLVRFEYSKVSQFEDRPTQTIWFRNLNVPNFSQKLKDNVLIIETDHLVITYDTSEPYTNFSLSVKLKENKKTWQYGDEEHGNLNGTARTLDGVNGGVPLNKGILSRDGFSTLDDSKALVFDENYWLTPRNEDAIDFYFFGYGKDYLQALNDYYRISGKTPMIPRYILGNWWSRYWEYSEDNLKDIVENFKKHEIPLSVCIIDMDWHIVHVDPKYIKNPETIRWSYGWTGYTWNKELFPDPKRMLDYLHDANLKVSLNLHPADGIRAHEFCYEEVADFMNVDKKAMDPVKFDIADPKFVSAYFDKVHHPHEDMGVDFWWLDWQQGERTKIQNLDPLWMLNHLHFFDSGRDKSKRPFTFSRFGSFGSHRYPIGFSGDTVVSWESLDFQPYFTLTASNIGYGWWSHDIGGHMGGIENGELYTRWVQLGVFSPILRLHSTKNFFSRREPWRYDQNVLNVARKYMRLRHQLIPYIYTMAYKNYAENLPLVRPLYYYEPNKEEAYKYRNEFFFGDELLVSPITKPMNPTISGHLHQFYLPEGEYFDFFNKEYFKGGKVNYNLYHLDDMPVFAKAGAIIPLAEDTPQNGTALPNKLVVEIFPLKSNTFTLFEDDGVSQDYLNGKVNLTKFTIHHENSLIFSIDKEESKALVSNRTYELHFNALEVKEINVLSDNKDVIYKSSQQEDMIIVEILSNDFNNLTIEFKGVNIIKKDLRIQKLLNMMFDAKVHSWRKQDIYHILSNETLNNEAKIEALLKVEDVPSDVYMTILHMLK